MKTHTKTKKQQTREDEGGRERGGYLFGSSGFTLSCVGRGTSL